MKKMVLANTDGQTTVFISEAIRKEKETGKVEWYMKINSNMMVIGCKDKNMEVVFIVLEPNN